MTGKIRFAAIHLALAAMLLRALLPSGWMPNSVGAGGTFLIACSADGSAQQANQQQHGQHTPDDGQHNHDNARSRQPRMLRGPVTIAQLAPAILFRTLLQSAGRNRICRPKPCLPRAISPCPAPVRLSRNRKIAQADA